MSDEIVELLRKHIDKYVGQALYGEGWAKTIDEVVEVVEEAIEAARAEGWSECYAPRVSEEKANYQPYEK
jgi:hypothetical protein